MISECPRCRRSVLLKDGLCPSCGLSPSDLGGLSGADLSLVPTQLSSHSKLPPICYHCAKPADLSFVLTRTSAAAGSHTVPILGRFFPPDIALNIFICLILVISALLYWTTRRIISGLPLLLILRVIMRTSEKVISLRIPVCSSCGNCKPDVDDLDWENYRMILMCHRDFRAALRNKT